jgi:hypothetical protein
VVLVLVEHAHVQHVVDVLHVAAMAQMSPHTALSSVQLSSNGIAQQELDCMIQHAQQWTCRDQKRCLNTFSHGYLK